MKFFRLILFLFLSAIALPCKASYAHVEHIGTEQGMPQTRVSGVLHDKNGYIWLATWTGLARYDGYSVKIFKDVPGRRYCLPSNRIYRIFQTRTGKIFCQIEKDYFIFDPQTGDFHKEKKPKHIPFLYHVPDSITNKVGSLPEFEGREFDIIYKDRQNGYWVRSDRGLDRVQFRMPPLMPVRFGDEMEEVVRCIGRCPSGMFFSDKNGFVRMQIGDGDDAHPLWLTKKGLSATRERFGSNIYSSVCYKGKNVGGKGTKDTLLLGTKPDGLYIVTTGKTAIETSLFAPTKGIGIYDIHRDSLGRIWLASLTGLYRIDDLSRPEIKKIKGFDRVRVIKEYQGTLLVGGDNGLRSFRLYDRGMEVHTPVDDEVVMDICIHYPYHHIYIATYGGGLLRIDKNQIISDMTRLVRYTTSEGLASNNLFSVTQWIDNNLYLVSEDALTEFNPDNNSARVVRKGTFTGNFAFTECKPYKTNSPHETLFFGTTHGVIEINRDDFPADKFTPRIVLSCRDTVLLSPDEKNITITFSALDYNKYEDITYAYYLEGLDDDWTITHERTVVYANLPPGEYMFHVRSTNGSGQWVANEHTVSIHRKAKLTETCGFWIGVGVFLLLAVIVIYLTIKYIRSLRRELREIVVAKDERIEYLYAHLRGLLSKTDVAKPEFPQKDDLLKKKVYDYLETHFSDSDLGIPDMGKELGMSQTKLFREIKLSFGISPNKLLQEYRVQKATEMLAGGARNVSEVAYAVGFTDPKYFCRVFKKYKGVAPSDFLSK